MAAADVPTADPYGEAAAAPADFAQASPPVGLPMKAGNRKQKPLTQIQTASSTSGEALGLVLDHLCQQCVAGKPVHRFDAVQAKGGEDGAPQDLGQKAKVGTVLGHEAGRASAVVPAPPTPPIQRSDMTGRELSKKHHAVLARRGEPACFSAFVAFWRFLCL